jgi:hypothetical protein
MGVDIRKTLEAISHFYSQQVRGGRHPAFLWIVAIRSGQTSAITAVQRRVEIRCKLGDAEIVQMDVAQRECNFVN